MSMSNYLENALGNAVLRNTTYTSPATVYLALHAGAPGETGASNEVSTSGTGYVRKAITFGAPTDGVFANSVAVTFDTATGQWAAGANIDNASIWDAASGGNCLYICDTLTNPQPVTTGGAPTFAIGAITVTHT